MTAALNPQEPIPYATTRYSEDAQADLLVASAPILDEGLAGAVRITRNVQDVSDAIRDATVGLIIVGAAGLLAGLLIAYGLAASFARPLIRLADTAEQLGEGDLSARAGDVGGAEEIEELARSFDEMADRMQRTVQAQREFVANASHQLRTPLTGMKLRLESATSRIDDPELRAQLEAADLEVDRLSETVDRMLVMSKRIEHGDPTHVDLAEAAGRAVTRWRDRRRDQRRRDPRDRGPSGRPGEPRRPRPGDRQSHRQRRWPTRPGPIELETGARRGPGRPRRARPRARDPEGGTTASHGALLPREDGPSGGSGLGLAIARDLTERWGGSLLVRDADGGGARIEIRLRAAEGRA